MLMEVLLLLTHFLLQLRLQSPKQFVSGIRLKKSLFPPALLAQSCGVAVVLEHQQYNPLYSGFTKFNAS